MVERQGLNTPLWTACICAFLTWVTAQAARADDYQALGEEIVAHVREQFLDVKRARAWAEKHARYGATVKDAVQFERRTNAALGELAASHTAYYPKESSENLQLRSLYASIIKDPAPEAESVGADFVKTPNGFFVRQVFAKSPAAAAGLLRGDRIISVDARPFDPVRSLRGKDGVAVLFEVARAKNAPPVRLSIAPRKTKPAEEWLAAQDSASQIVERLGRRVAYASLYSCAGPKPLELLQRIMDERFAGAEALVLDLRDGWGGCPPEFLKLFNPVAPTLRMVGRDGKARVWPASWRKPVVLVTNKNTRSGKEIVAFEFRKHAIGPIVGERTAGAFLMGRPLPLSDGSLLYLAVEKVEIDGVALEGSGVAPTVEVADTLFYAAGADPQRERALTLAAELAVNL
ncbi:MAG TPA: S41 family peptidase [Polyangiaceae bacterium]|jgi:carboxyl-terminal processing protease|nr:S41 family peptidase [Polyangiaceae bacterium]